MVFKPRVKTTIKKTITLPRKSFKRKARRVKLFNTSTNDPLRSSMNVKLVYTETKQYSTGSGGICGVENVYRLSGLHDPDFTGTGHQPYGWDQMKALYYKYKVKGVTIETEFTDPSFDGMAVVVAVQPSNELYTTSNQELDFVSEKPLTVVKNINNTGNQKVKLKQYFSLQSLSGLTKTQFNADMTRYAGTSSSDPPLSPWLRVNCGSRRGRAADTVICTVKITYHVNLFGRILMPTS